MSQSKDQGPQDHAEHNDDVMIEQNSQSQQTPGPPSQRSITEGGYWQADNILPYTIPSLQTEWQGEDTRSTLTTVPLHVQRSVNISGSTAKITPSSRLVVDKSTLASLTSALEETVHTPDIAHDTNSEYSVVGSTSTDIRRSKIKEAGLSDDVRRALVDEAIAKIKSQLNTTGSISEYFRTLMMKTEEEIKRWIDDVLKANTSISEASKKRSADELSSLQERVALLETKIDVLIKSEKDDTVAQQSILSESMKILRENEERRRRFRTARDDGKDLDTIIQEELIDDISVVESERHMQLADQVKILENRLAQYENLPTDSRTSNSLSPLRTFSNAANVNLTSRQLNRNLRNL